MIGLLRGTKQEIKQFEEEHMNKHHGLILVGATGVAILAWMHFKGGMVASAIGITSPDGMPVQVLGGQSQYASGTHTGTQVSDLRGWGGTYNDVPLHQDNTPYSGAHIVGVFQAV
jgi:hypothetical protein